MEIFSILENKRDSPELWQTILRDFYFELKRGGDNLESASKKSKDWTLRFVKFINETLDDVEDIHIFEYSQRQTLRSFVMKYMMLILSKLEHRNILRKHKEKSSSGGFFSCVCGAGSRRYSAMLNSLTCVSAPACVCVCVLKYNIYVVSCRWTRSCFP